MRRAVGLALVALVVLLAGCGSTPRANQAAPMISHTKPGFVGGPPPAAPIVGDVLFTSSGQWSGSPTGFAYAWKDCNSSGGSCTTASGSPTNTTRYAIVSGDVGFTIRVAVTASYSGHPDSTVMSQPTAIVSNNLFPLQVSPSGKFLETNGGAPFLMVGDAPQALVGNLSTASATTYFADRESHGFNAAWANLLCDGYTFCASSGETFDGVAPFNSGSGPSSYIIGDATKENSTYFARAHADIAAAQADGIEVFLDPIETGGCDSGGWIDTLTNASNGDGTVSTSDGDYKYGQYLGTTFGDLNNIVWLSGNDYQCFTTTNTNNDVKTVANGIHNTDPAALQTLEADFCGGGGCQGSTSLIGSVASSGASTGWSGQVQLNAVYSYQNTYGAMSVALAQTSTKPNFMVEANYDGEHISGDDGGGDDILRKQEWWAMTSGAAGSLYGCGCTDGIVDGFTTGSIDTTGVTELGYQTGLLTSIDWQNLAPDQSLISSGGGSCPTTGLMATNTCVTAALTSSDKTAVVYVPTSTSPVLNMSQFATTNVVGRWFDPTHNTYTNATGTPFANTGTHTFTTPGSNNAGDTDWVLLLQAP